MKILRHFTHNINSVLKMFIDLFSLPETAGLFYSNDNKVLIDILVRQLSDLSAGDPVRLSLERKFIFGLTMFPFRVPILEYKCFLTFVYFLPEAST